MPGAKVVPGGAAVVQDARVARLRTLSRLLDSQFRIPGTNFRFGLDAIVGLVPGLGDVAGAVASSAIIFEAARLGAPKTVLARMMANVGLEMLVGAVPALGDLFDVVFKANNRNMRLVEGYISTPDLTKRSSRAFLLWLAIGLAALVVVAGVLAVVIGIAVYRAIASGRGPL
jgi:hypothetical protein